MYCPTCRSEYREGIAKCAHCDVALVPELPPEDVFASSENMARALADKEVQPVVVGQHTALRDAQQALARERIASVVATEDENEATEAGVHARFYLMVAGEDLERAKLVLQKKWQDGALAQGLVVSDVTSAATDACPACGTAVPSDAAECPDCGLYLGEASTPTAPE